MYEVGHLVSWVGDDQPRLKKGWVGVIESIDWDAHELTVDFGYTDMGLVRAPAHNFSAGWRA